MYGWIDGWMDECIVLWCDMMWCDGMVWSGLIWYGMEWNGMVCMYLYMCNVYCIWMYVWVCVYAWIVCPSVNAFAFFVDTGAVVSVLRLCVVVEVSGSGPGSYGRISGAAQNPRSTQDLEMNWGWISSRDQNLGWLVYWRKGVYICKYIYI